MGGKYATQPSPFLRGTVSPLMHYGAPPPPGRRRISTVCRRRRVWTTTTRPSSSAASPSFISSPEEARPEDRLNVNRWVVGPGRPPRPCSTTAGGFRRLHVFSILRHERLINGRRRFGRPFIDDVTNSEDYYRGRGGGSAGVQNLL